MIHWLTYIYKCFLCISVCDFFRHPYSGFPSSIFCIYLLHPPQLELHPFPAFPFQITGTPVAPFPAAHPPWKWSLFILFIFLGFVVIPGCVLTSEDLELGASEEHVVFVFLGTGLTPSIWSFLVPFIYQQIPWFHSLCSWIVFLNVHVPHFSLSICVLKDI